MVGLLEAWEIVLKKNSGEIQLIIIGEGTGYYYQKFLNKIGSINNVQYIKYVPRDKIDEYYYQADAFICVSASDSLPVVVTEAFMFGVPCIVSNGVGHYKLVKDDVNAYTCQFDNVNSIANAIMKAYEKRNKNIGKNGRKIYDKYFSIEKLMDELVIEV